MNWRYIDLGAIDPFMGPAAFEAVMDSVRQEKEDPTLLFWRPGRPAVYIGYHQVAGEDIEIGACARDGVPVIRRILGGGTGYCDRQQIIYNVMFREEDSGIPMGPKAAYHYVLPGVVHALNLLGVMDASIEEHRYGVYASGKKISGSGQLSSSGVINSSGSFLIGFDFASMKKYLRNPVKNLRRGINEPEEGMTCLVKELGREVSVKEAAAALRKGFEKALGETHEAGLSPEEASAAEKLVEKYSSLEWTYRADERKRRRKK